MTGARRRYAAAVAATSVLWCGVYVVSPLPTFLGAGSAGPSFVLGIVAANVGICLAIRRKLRRVPAGEACLWAPVWLLLGIAIAFDVGSLLSIPSSRDTLDGFGQLLLGLLVAPIPGILFAIGLAWYLLVPGAFAATWILWHAARNEPAERPEPASEAAR